MAQTHEVKFYRERVNVTVKNATQEFLEALAYQVEGLVKRNIQRNGQIDTGFMLNSAHTITPKTSGWRAAQSLAKARNPKARMSPARSLRRGDAAAVCVGAEYAIYNEARMAFLYPAGQEAAQQAGGVAKSIYQRKVKD